MAKVWSTLTDGYSNENIFMIPFINGVGWARDGVHARQFESWYGYHVDRSTHDQPDALDKATREEITDLCTRYSIDMTDKPKWTLVDELKAVIGVETPAETEVVYSLNLQAWLTENM